MVVLKVREMKRIISYQHKIPAKVHLLSGKTIEGKVFSDLPMTHARLSDFLNQSKAFFYLEVGDKDYLANSQLVKIVYPIPSGQKTRNPKGLKHFPLPSHRTAAFR